MKKAMLALLFAMTFAPAALQGQGTFQNLNFEGAHNLPSSGGSGATTNLLPGWSAFSGSTELVTITYNASTFIPTVGLRGSNNFHLNGSFSVLLTSSGSIRQTGLVPVGTESLLFAGYLSGTPLLVSLGGQSLAYFALSNAPNYTLYGADISAFAGQTATLVFNSSPSSAGYIDDIQISSQVIPEPSSLALLSCGGLLLAAWRCRVRPR